MTRDERRETKLFLFFVVDRVLIDKILVEGTAGLVGVFARIARLPQQSGDGQGYMAVFATVGGYWMWFRGLSVIDASAAAPFLFVQPLLGAALGVALLGESLTWATMAGAVLILSSLMIVTLGASSREAELLVSEPPQ